MRVQLIKRQMEKTVFEKPHDNAERNMLFLGQYVNRIKFFMEIIKCLVYNN